MQQQFDAPVSNVQWVKVEELQANDYNPNSVAPPEMKLLEISIIADGYTQPIVTYYDDQANKYIIVDGFHRYRVGCESKTVYERYNGHVPIVTIDKPLQERISSTIRHNRARGKHSVLPMCDIVKSLVELGWNDDRIGMELGMSADEVLRLKQFTGLPDLFRNEMYTELEKSIDAQETINGS
jgi:ParB-like chromosome segregation protein Spo0J